MQISLNNRVREKTNFENVDDLQNAVRVCEKYKKTLYLTLNSKWFPQECFIELNSYIQEIQDIGIKHLIVSDIGLINFLSINYPDMKLSISCLNEIYNSASVDFYKQFNPERIVFPRHIDIRDVEMIVNEHKSIDFEVFVLSDKCIYDDGNCRCFHDWGPICQENWSTNYIGRKGTNMITREFLDQIEDYSTKFLRWSNDYYVGNKDIYKWSHVGCSICALFNLVQIPNLVSYKVVGRGYKLEEKIFQAQLVNKVIKKVINGASIESLMEYMEDFSGEKTFCQSGMHCIMRGYKIEKNRIY